MKKVELVTKFLGKEDRRFVGYEFSIRWKPTDYHGGPVKPGRYYVIKEDGALDEMLCTGTGGDETGLDLFSDIINRSYNHVYYDDDYSKDYGEADSKLVELARTYCVWYDVIDDRDSYGEWMGEDLVIYKKPRYWLNMNLEGGIPVPDETENYETIKIDKDTD